MINLAHMQNLGKNINDYIYCGLVKQADNLVSTNAHHKFFKIWYFITDTNILSSDESYSRKIYNYSFRKI